MAAGGVRGLSAPAKLSLIRKPRRSASPCRVTPVLTCVALSFPCASADPECALERPAEDAETGRLRKRLLSPEEAEEGEEDDEEPALHSCDSCRQVFESLSDLTEHKINQCQLTAGVKEKDAIGIDLLMDEWDYKYPDKVADRTNDAI
ncbi:Zinc finger protein 521 [Liparis tanakae]|uniref:Zinc finger protein 521 n=1 Tax=Liparis tanakae TaxID=230148 RepID=A0A4Z2GQN8_9TELE|nr:Zinc finger protein 521 [Liparis tanakae]